MTTKIATDMYQWASDLYPICRSITGQGVRDTLHYLNKLLPNLSVKSVASGTKVFDWEIPEEWNVNDAYIKNSLGERIVDFKVHNLHLVGYSEPINITMSFDELKPHLYYIEDQPDAIPYITSYYKKRWGFCLTYNQFLSLSSNPKEKYHIVIDSTFSDGCLNYGELLIPGQTDDEIFLSTYICHPSMANNELSGPVVTSALAMHLLSLKGMHRYTYRIIYIPETIGSITYLAKNITHLKQKVKAGFNISCVGDNRAYSYLPSKQENTLSDRVALHALKYLVDDYRCYSFLDRGSDERQYCSPGVDLPICSIMRTKYGDYPEYHTSLDDLSLISPDGLYGAYNVIKKAIDCIENNEYLKVNVLCEPQLGKRGLYPTISTKKMDQQVSNMMNFISYCDGTIDTLTIAEKIDVPLWTLTDIISTLKSHNLITAIKNR